MTPPDDKEPATQLRRQTYERHGVVLIAALALLVTCLCKRSGDETGSTTLVAIWFPALLVCATISILERPVRAWRQRRHARMVARGVMELEAQVARDDDGR